MVEFSKQGNRHLRWLLVAGAMAVIRYARQHGTKRLWLVRLMGRRPTEELAGCAGQYTAHGLGHDGGVESGSRSRSCCRRHSYQRQAEGYTELARA